ncbi:MAG: hypothetical protein ACM3YN_13595 [Parcubacteria group bacterium]
MFHDLPSKIYLGVIFLTVAFAWWKGERAERIGSLFNAVLTIGVVLFQSVTHQAFGSIPILIGDGFLATGFLFLAFRYASLWLAAAMVLQAASFLIHASLLMNLLPTHRFYLAAMNVLGALVMLVILLGTAGAWYRRTHPRAALA